MLATPAPASALSGGHTDLGRRAEAGAATDGEVTPLSRHARPPASGWAALRLELSDNGSCAQSTIAKSTRSRGRAGSLRDGRVPACSLGLKAPQEREAVRVLLHCCLQERAANPFYAFLAGRLCAHHRRFQMTFQFSIWDKLRELERLPATGLANLAHLVAHLLKTRALPLSVLKVVEFSELDKPRVHFLQKVLHQLLMETEAEDLALVFARVADSPKLGLFREGLKLFISHFLPRRAQHLSAEAAGQLPGICGGFRVPAALPAQLTVACWGHAVVSSHGSGRTPEGDRAGDSRPLPGRCAHLGCVDKCAGEGWPRELALGTGRPLGHGEACSPAPGRRAEAAVDPEKAQELERLKRRVKGLINRYEDGE
ncbi:PREDICTED: nucleolar MIF4G domain-containing protein 1 [Condylura cristata]|uniref:nucleolar MIF4G domain-containing protein 1 n=1 Tax=Condylura cristata TaxID=143302 RepID=UPI000643928C|nr:PREDICTED: nucleolar MIF4G domain-containing protein 1 [Condylura cristata]